MVVCNKIDIVPLEELSEENKTALKFFEEKNIPVLSMSTVTDEGVMEVKEFVSLNLLMKLELVLFPSLSRFIIVSSFQCLEKIVLLLQEHD